MGKNNKACSLHMYHQINLAAASPLHSIWVGTTVSGTSRRNASPWYLDGGNSKANIGGIRWGIGQTWRWDKVRLQERTGACKSALLPELTGTTYYRQADAPNRQQRMSSIPPLQNVAEVDGTSSKTHALDIFGYAWYDPLGVGLVLHISKWTLAGDVRNPRTRRTQLDKHCQHAWMDTKRSERIVIVRISCIILYSQNHGSLGRRQPALCPHRCAGEFYITDQRAGWSRLAGQVRSNVCPIRMKPGI